MSERTVDHAPAKTAQPAVQGVLQRKCACGQHTTAGGECESCRQKRQSLQRKAANRAEPDTVPPIVHEVLRGPGQPLDSATRAFMEPHFGHDFSRVRVHTNARAAESARTMNALAYTVGRDLVFDEGQYRPESGRGRRLLAHELTHAVQQGKEGRGAASPSNVETVSSAPAEYEASRAAQAIAHGGPFQVSLRQGPAIARQESSTEEVPQEHSGPGTEENQSSGTEETGTAGETAGGSASGTTAQSGCSPTPLSRRKFLKQKGTSQSEFGLTTLDSLTVTFPQLNFSRRGRRVQVKPTTASLGSISSVYTRAGRFKEGEIRVADTPGADCPKGKYPLYWRIMRRGADKIRDGEQEHCNDFQHAFDISLGRYRDAINRLASRGSTFPSERAAKRRLRSDVGFSFDELFKVFACLAQRSEGRDNAPDKWHTPTPLYRPPNRNNRCGYVMATVHERSLPHVGQHPTPDLIKDCGETPASRARSRRGRR